MQGEYRDQLPPRVLELLDRIEGFAGMEIRVQQNPRPVSTRGPNPNAPAISVAGHGATIFIRGDFFPPEGIAHELLHAHRYWVESVPQIVPKDQDKERWQIAREIENSLEHTVIVPRETRYTDVDRAPYWNASEAHVWSDFRQFTNAWTRRKTALLAYLETTKLVTDPAITERASAILHELGLLADAKRFVAQVGGRIAREKPRAIAVVVDALQIPRHEARLLYVDPRRRLERYEDIPPSPRG